MADKALNIVEEYAKADIEAKIGICAVLAIITKQWLALGIFDGIFAGIFALSLVVLFGAGTIMAVIETMRDGMKEFVRS